MPRFAIALLVATLALTGRAAASSDGGPATRLPTAGSPTFFLEAPPTKTQTRLAPPAAARAFVEGSAERLGLGSARSRASIVQIRSVVDGHGRTHVTFRKVLGGLPVEGCEVTVHVGSDGAPLSATGEVPASLAQSEGALVAAAQRASTTEDVVRSTVLADLAKDGSEASEVAHLTATPWLQTSPPRAVWHVDVVLAHGRGRWDYLVDGETGLVLSRRASLQWDVPQAGEPPVITETYVRSYAPTADGDSDGFPEAYSFDIGVDAVLSDPADVQTVAAVIRCTTTGTSVTTPTWTIHGTTHEITWFPLTQADFPGTWTNLSLDFTVELRNAALTQVLAVDESVVGEPLRADHIAPGSFAGAGRDALGAPVPHIDSTYSDAYFEYDLIDTTRRAGNDPHGHHGRMAADAVIETAVDDPTAPFYAWDLDDQWVESYESSAVSAHANAAIVYDWLLAELGQNSFDGAGSSMTSFVEVLSCQDNAAWDGHEMLACQGRPYIAELDVTAHEWGHALTEKAPGARRSDLAYEKESGALNEAFSDWLGTAIEQSHFPGSANWTLGETIEAFRDMADPPRFQQPDTYRQGAWWIDTLACTPTEGNDECGVHTNSGVPNKAFYLLAHGGTFGGVAVPGVGIGTAIRIAFDANVHYWPASATFMDARDGMIAAAQPYGMPAVQSVRNAWAAVGVGALAPVPGDVAPRAAPNASVDIADVVQELRYSVGLDTASAQELARGDIAPSDVIDPASNPVVVRPRPDGQVNISDVVLLLRASVGLSTFG